MHVRKSPLLTFVLLASAVALPPLLPAHAKSPRPMPSGADGPLVPIAVPAQLPISRFTLANGLRVVVQTDKRAPLVAVGLMAHVGSRDEEPGLSGLAHFFEHMMFQGSAHVGKMEHVRQIQALGGEANASTSTDATYFHQVVPKNALELVLWLEADRLLALKIDQDNVDNQRQAVLEERRERIENEPYAMSALRLEELLFSNWALGHPTIGSVGDLQQAPLQSFVAFWKRWYAPQNLVLALVGDVTVEEAETLLGRTLGRLPRRGEVNHRTFADADPTTHVYARHDEVLGKTPAFQLAWRVPASPHPDSFALDLLAEVVGGGASSRLEKLLTRDLPLATAYSVGTLGRQGVDGLVVNVQLASSGLAGVDEAKKRVRTTLREIAVRGVSAAELRRAQETFLSGWVFGTQSLERKAEFLARFELFEGDAQKANGLLAAYLAVQPADLQRVARQYLTFDREVELDVLPQGHPLPKEGGLKPGYVARAETEEKATEAAKQRAAEAAVKESEAAAQREAEAVAKRARAEEEAKANAERAKLDAEQRKIQAEQARLDAERARAQADQAKAQADQVKAQAEQAKAEAAAAARLRAADEAARKAAEREAAKQAALEAKAAKSRKSTPVTAPPAAPLPESARKTEPPAPPATVPAEPAPAAAAPAAPTAPVAAPPVAEPVEELSEEEARAAAAARAAMEAKAAEQARAAAEAKAAAQARVEAEARADAERKAAARARMEAEARAEAERKPAPDAKPTPEAKPAPEPKPAPEASPPAATAPAKSTADDAELAPIKRVKKQGGGK